MENKNVLEVLETEEVLEVVEVGHVETFDNTTQCSKVEA